MNGRNYPPLAGAQGVEIRKNMKSDKSNNYGYNKNLQQLANKLRKNMTKAEACLWKYALKARQMRGYQFRRQRPVLNYIADFMYKELKLIIEVDGYSHHIKEVVEKDDQKQKDLEAAGFRVIRFSDEQVLKDMANVKLMICGIIEELEESTP